MENFFQCNLWFDTRLDSDNSRNFVDISKLSKGLDYVKELSSIITLILVNY